MHLSACFMDIFAYVSCFAKSVEVRQPDYHDVREQIRSLLAASEKLAAENGIDGNDYDQARFALCAWVDEKLLSANWQQKSYWMKDQLQRSHYNTTDAGEEFFTRLESLGLHQREVREIFYLCLALGFTGRHCRPGDEYHLQQIRIANLKLLLGSSVGLPPLDRTDLFPEAWPTVGERSRPRKRRAFDAMSVICLVAPVLLFGLLYLIYRFTLNGVADNFLKTVVN